LAVSKARISVRLAAGLLLALLGPAIAAFGAVIFQDDFESAPQVATGAPKQGPDADPAASVGTWWVRDKEGVWCEQVTTYSPPGPHSGAKYLRLTSPTDSEARATFAAAQAKNFMADFWVYATYDGFRIYLCDAADNIGGWLSWGEAGTGVIAYRRDSTFTKTVCAYTHNQWQHVTLIYNYSSTAPTMDVIIDNSSALAVPFNDDSKNAIASLLFVGGNPTQYVYLDDVLVTDTVPTEVVTVDLATDQGPVTYRASGILASLSVDSPSDQYIQPLKPQLWRERTCTGGIPGTGAFACATRVEGLGMTIHVVLGHCFGAVPAPGDNGNWTPWDTYVHDTVAQALDGNYNFMWDIWNEPPNNWYASTDQFNEMWRRTVDQIRALYLARGKTAVIVGPGCGGYLPDYIQAFLIYAKTHYDSRGQNVLPDILDWHDAGWDQHGYTAIPSNVTYMRNWMAANGINIQPITLGEIIGNHLQTKPGPVAWFLASVDRSGVDGATKMCWTDQSGDNCNNHSLDGLLDNVNNLPRSTWWAYKAYADLAGTLLAVTPSRSAGGIAALNSCAQGNGVGVLLGRDRPDGAAADIQLVFTHVPCVPASCQVQIIAQRIPDSGWNPLAAPLATINGVYPVTNNQVTLALPNWGITDAYAVQVVLPQLVGDLNRDCRVNQADLTILAENWLTCTGPACD
jgi:hypothetical protein